MNFMPPLPANLLKRHHFFELYPFDGGGGFIHHDILKSLNDFEITERIVRDKALNDFGELPFLDFQRFEDWSSIEKSCWINRCYFVVSMARVAFLKNDRELASVVKDTILGFYRRYAPAGTPADIVAEWRRVMHIRDEEYNKKGIRTGKIAYQWFDFQPASRMINFIHALYFIRNMEVVSAAEWDEFEKMLKVHAELLLIAESTVEVPTARDNHQVIRGLALLLAACFFKGTEEAERYSELALPLLEFHIHNDYLPDGLLAEISPSYHAFQTWMTRDTVLLADRYGLPLADQAREVLLQAAKACRTLTGPDGYSVVLNDGYPLNFEIFLESLGETGKGNTGEETLLPNARIAVSRRNDFFLLFDCSPETGPLSHYHPGKNAVTLWLGTKPFLVDSGCPNYDDPDFSGYFKRPEAHSTLLLDGQGDSRLAGLYHWEITADTGISKWSRHQITGTLSSKMPAWQGKTWKRSLTLNDACLEIHDSIETFGATAEFYFILHPSVRVEEKGHAFLLINGEHRLVLTWECNQDTRWDILPGMIAADWSKHPSQRLRATVQAGTIDLKTCWRISSR